MKAVQASVEDIIVTKDNARKNIEKDPAFEALKVSINQNGVIVPLLVVEKDGKYELRAGERRLRACKALGLTTVPVTVLDGEKIDPMVITILENSNRKALTVVERAAEALTLLKKMSNDLTAVAAVLNLGEQELACVKKIAGMHKLWLDHFTEHGDETSGISLAMIGLIAREPASIQEALYRNNMDGRLARMKTGELRAYLAKYHALVKSFPWTEDEAIASSPLCKGCAKRSSAKGQADFFKAENDAGNDMCLDTQCYKDKHLAWATAKANEIRKDAPKALLVVSTNDYHLKYMLAEAIEAEGYTRNYGYNEPRFTAAKKSDPNAVPCWVFTDTDVKMKYVTKPTKPKAEAKEKEKKPATAAEAMAQKKEGLEGLRHKIVIQKLSTHIQSCDRPKELGLLEVAGLVAALGTNVSNHGVEDVHWPAVLKAIRDSKGSLPYAADWKNSKHSKALPIEDILWASVRMDLSHQLRFQTGIDAFKCKDYAKQCATLTSFDYEAAYKAACEEKPVPKSWKRAAAKA